MTKRDTTVLLLIDPQIDFCHEEGSLFVPGAIEDCKRTAAFINQNKLLIEEIYVTLDSHHKKHIAHASFWCDDAGKCPEPFTVIQNHNGYDLEDGVGKKWYPKDRKLTDYCLEYCKALQSNPKRCLVIWPDHCLIGTVGHGVADVIHDALMNWNEVWVDRTVKYVHKGMNLYTEMYSAIEADVPVPSDYRTKRNIELLEELSKSSKLFICGQALSHCVNYTARDIIKYWEELQKKERSNRGAPRVPRMSDMIFLSDCASNVAGFSEAGKEFVEHLESHSVQIFKSVDLLNSPQMQELCRPRIDHE